MYKVIILPDAEKSVKKLDKIIQFRIVEKIDWLADNAETIVHHLLASLPDDLKGLCKAKVGDYSILILDLQKEKAYSSLQY
ncbi:MAG: type II toxin-antitoxin system RelE/ParE family toxin [Thermodesulfobacteriota bacterium]